MNEKYYNDNAKSFIDNTIDCDMSYLYNFFLKYLPKDSKTILDLGFGSGRDSLYFSKSFEVYAIDPVEVFVDNAKNNLGLDNVYCMSAEDVEFKNKFDGIWACASLLHIESKNLNLVFKNLSRALKANGVIYCSFKYGEFEGMRNGRFYLDMNEENITKYLTNTNLEIIDKCLTDDVRTDRNEKWLNLILKKN